MNHENALEMETCRGIYRAIAVEIMRAVNFYGYSNPASALQTAWLVGGGARNAPLVEQLRQTVSLTLLPAGELLPPGRETDEALGCCPAAVGVTQQ